MYRDTIPFALHGIPCLIGVIDFLKVEGCYRHDAVSEADYRGYTDLDYDLLDRKGYRASWLENKVDQHVCSDIRQAVIDYYKQ